MKTAAYLCAAALLATPCLAAADGFSYTSVAASLGHAGMDELQGGATYELAGSYGLGPYLFLDADYSHSNFGNYPQAVAFAVSNSAAFFNPDLTEKRRQFGIGAHISLSSTTDAVVRLRTDHYDLANRVSQVSFVSPVQDSASGYDLGVGVRTLLMPQLELSAFLDHDTAGLDYQFLVTSASPPTSSENVVSTGLHWYFMPHFDLGLSYESRSFDGQHRALVSARWDF